MIDQAVGQAKDFSHLYEGAALVVALAISKVLDHRKGKSRDHDRHDQQTRIENGIHAVQRDMRELKAEVRSTRELVIGYDGQNGLRGDLREAERRIGEIEQRELDAARRVS